MLLLLFFVNLTLLSCGKSKIEEDINSLMGKRVSVPSSVFLRYNDVSATYLDSCEYKYVVYLDSTVCSSCTLKNLYYWEVLRDSVATLDKNVALIFIYAPSKGETGRFLNDLKNGHEQLLSYVDTSGYFRRENPFIPDNSNLHAFLLDGNNRIIMVGNAQSNPAVEKLFFHIITDSHEK